MCRLGRESLTMLNTETRKETYTTFWGITNFSYLSVELLTIGTNEVEVSDAEALEPWTTACRSKQSKVQQEVGNGFNWLIFDDNFQGAFCNVCSWKLMASARRWILNYVCYVPSQLCSACDKLQSWADLSRLRKWTWQILALLLMHKLLFPHLASLFRRNCQLTLQTCCTIGRIQWIYC